MCHILYISFTKLKITYFAQSAFSNYCNLCNATKPWNAVWYDTVITVKFDAILFTTQITLMMFNFS